LVAVEIFHYNTTEQNKTKQNKTNKQTNNQSINQSINQSVSQNLRCSTPYNSENAKRKNTREDQHKRNGQKN
jgi:hypothetical protein